MSNIQITRRLFSVSFLLIFCSVLLTHAQVNGKVTDKNNDPLPGVTVKLKNTTTGTITGLNGEYSITKTNEKSVLVFSYIGYETHEVLVGNQKTINVSLLETTLNLEQVVVVGYGTMKRSDLTGAISSISSNQIMNMPVTNVGQALQGRMSGVQVTNNDGTPGAGVQVLIRGVGSFGDNSPLYVIDGYPGASTTGLNPSDIESIDVLKDASASAIYGNRAANGVVIITTKRGNKDGMQITANATTSVQFKPKTYDVLNAQQFATLATEVSQLQNVPVLAAWNTPESLRNIDWQNVMFQSGLKQDYNISLRGGSDKSQSSLSLGLTDQTGIVLFSHYKRYNAAITQDFTPYKWLKSSTSVRYAYSDTKVTFGSGQGGVGRLAKLIPTMTGNPVTDQVVDENGNYGYYDKNASAVRDNENVYYNSKMKDNKNIGQSLIGSTSLEITPVKGLSIKTNFGINFGTSAGYNFSPYNDNVPTTWLASYSQRSNNSFEWLWENTATYSNTFGFHKLDIMAGVSAQENTSRNMSASGSGLTTDGLRNISSLKTYTAVGNNQTWSMASQFARLTYKFQERYIVTGTVRRDGSSRFADGKKYGIFPSISGAWRIKEESFLKDVNAISNLKLRASYGEAGNQNIGLFQYQSSYTTGTATANKGYVFGDTKTYVDGLALAYLPNPDLKWETSIQKDFGVDFGFFDNKLSFTADYFIKESKDFLLNIQMPAQTGFTQATRNVGSIKNTGFEFVANYQNNDNKFKYGINVNLTTVKNKIEELAPGQNQVSNLQSLEFPTTTSGNASWAVFSMSKVGGSIGEFYGFQTDGIIQSQAEIDALNANAKTKNGSNVYYIASGTAPGDRKFKDQDGNGMITDADRVNIGSPMPKFYGGFNLNGEYENFDFNIFFNYSVGNKILNYVKRNLTSMGGNGSVGLENVSTDFYNNRWTVNNPTNEYSRAVWSDVNGNSRVSDAFVEDGSYLKLKNIEVGYTLPSKLTKKASISKLRILASVQNLLTITKYSGQDPEIGQSASASGGVAGGVTASGIDVGIYPYSRFFSMGLNLQF